ncbi:adenylate/guanylate cyclase domain-containing protein [Bradyrhizobium ivorense]|uniref:adenylate/guanylate cyclase domain-containing protein n=1 Tax=Bradyrhizobium ivorense TaxID=2511166 RepID=UPI0010B2376A|nr:adenylate/guanylate cyclase domain-containing protein [Bradyrhizobium ivorense]VIO70958.1 Adenylate cyclase 1 [Bradyrhizobium ivorense]
MEDTAATPRQRPLRIGFRTSIITVFVAVVLVVGLTLVWLSFERVSRITRTAASGFIEKVAQLGAEHIDEQFKNVRDSLQILGGIPAVQEADIEDNPRLYGLMASMLRSNPQLFNLYVGYEDGSFLEMDVIDRAKPAFRASLKVDEDAVFRLVVISRTGNAAPVTRFLSDNLIEISEVTGPNSYDPRNRQWYVEALKNDQTLLTGPYVFYATGEAGYTLRMPSREGRRGALAGDILVGGLEDMLKQQQLGASGLAFLFDDAGRIVGHPEMSRLMAEMPERGNDLPKIDAIRLSGLAPAIRSWRESGRAQHFFDDADGHTYVAAFHRIETAGNANIRLATVARLDEFFSTIIAERRILFAIAIAFVAAMLPLAFGLGSMLARSLRDLAHQTDEIQHFQLADRPRLKSMISEIDELGRSVFTMRTVIRSFASFIPRQIVRQLIETGTALELGGTRREITALFTDVENFTAKTEKADPSNVMIHTSRYFAALSEAIMSHHGTVDKFIGDAVMAFWNAPADDPEHVVHACRAVLDCLRRNAELNRRFEEERWPPYVTRFGLHMGEAVVGNVGSIDRMNYTALGATINLAARLEGLNKNYGTQVLVSEAVKARAEAAFVFRSVDRISPKGFAEAFNVYELVGQRDEVEPPFCRRWNAIYTSMQTEGTAISLVRVIRYLADYPEDRVAKYHLERLRAVSGQHSADAAV